MTQEKLPLSSSSWSGAWLARWLAMAYAMSIFAGVIVFRLPGAMVTGNEQSWPRSVFTVVNAATLTGFQQAVALDEYGASGQICVIALTVSGALFTLIIGGLALKRALKLESTDLQIVGSAVFTFVFCIGVGTSLLLEPTRGLLDSATQACSAFANSGLYLGKLPGVTDWRTHLPLLPLAIVGGMSIPVLQELVDFVFRRRPLSKHTQIVLIWLAAIYLIGVLVTAPWLTDENGHILWKQTLATGSALSINGRTCGLPLASLALPRVSQWMLMVLMSIGAAPGGTAAGLGVTTLYQAWRGMRCSLLGEKCQRIAGIAFTWIFAYGAIVLAAFLILLACVPEMAADRLAFLAASAVSNCGLSHEPVVLTGGGIWVLTAAMLIGRAAPLAVLWWAAGTTSDVDVAV